MTTKLVELRFGTKLKQNNGLIKTVKTAENNNLGSGGRSKRFWGNIISNVYARFAQASPILGRQQLVV